MIHLTIWPLVGFVIWLTEITNPDVEMGFDFGDVLTFVLCLILGPLTLVVRRYA